MNCSIIFGPSLALLVPFLGNALAQHAWPLAALLTVVVAVGLWVIASAASGAFPVARLANSRLVDAGTAGDQ